MSEEEKIEPWDRAAKIIAFVILLPFIPFLLFISFVKFAFGRIATSPIPEPELHVPSPPCPIPCADCKKALLPLPSTRINLKILVVCGDCWLKRVRSTALAEHLGDPDQTPSAEDLNEWLKIEGRKPRG